MKDEYSIFDVSGELLSEGDLIILLAASEKLLVHLPFKDQIAIKAQVGNVIPIQSFDEFGNVELEFKCEDGDVHFIWVESSQVMKIKGSD